MPSDDPARLDRVTAVILAAGESRRFGGAKLLASLAGRPLLQHVIDAANASHAHDVILVVGHRRDELLAAVQPGRARIVVNDEYASGQSTSLRAALRAALGADAIVVLLGDQPRVSARVIDAVVARARESGAVAVVCVSRGRRSPPTLLQRSLWPALDALRGDVGAREVIAGRDDVATLEVAPGELDDVDEPADLARLDQGTAGNDRSV